jgi:hypothetical protein
MPLQYYRYQYSAESVSGSVGKRTLANRVIPSAPAVLVGHQNSTVFFRLFLQVIPKVVSLQITQVTSCTGRDWYVRWPPIDKHVLVFASGGHLSYLGSDPDLVGDNMEEMTGVPQGACHLEQVKVRMVPALMILRLSFLETPPQISRASSGVRGECWPIAEISRHGA